MKRSLRPKKLGARRGARPTRRSTPPTASDHVRHNRVFWERESDEYDRRFRGVLGGAQAMTWGLWRVPESELRLLGEVGGRDLLELGCGAARWSIALAQRGARPVGLDLSASQLAKARALVRAARVRVPLVRASAEAIPFGPGSFDLVFCDWGAMTFCDPHRTVPGSARVLRPGGHLIFATASPVRMIAHDRRADRQTLRLQRPYFGMHRLEFGGTVEFQMGYGDWVALFAENDLEVVRLIESRPPRGRRSVYLRPDDARWAERWPMETIWKVRKKMA